MKRAIVFMANGMEECEALITVDLLRRAGVDVKTVSIHEKKQVVSTHNIEITADALISEIALQDFDAVILPGGIPGTPNLAACSAVRDTCLSFAADGKIVAAICAAPSILAKLGLLAGKPATIYPGMEDELLDAVPVADEVAVSEQIITSRSMGTAIPFALTLVAKLVCPSVAKTLAEEIGYAYF